MATEPENVLTHLRRIDEKLDRLLECLAAPRRGLVRGEKIDIPEPSDRLSALLDQFEKLSPEEQRRDIERTNEYLSIHGLDALRERHLEEPLK